MPQQLGSLTVRDVKVDGATLTATQILSLQGATALSPLQAQITALEARIAVLESASSGSSPGSGGSGSSTPASAPSSSSSSSSSSSPASSSSSSPSPSPSPAPTPSSSPVSSPASSTITYMVTVAGGQFVIEGTAAATLSLTAGNTYVFNQSDGSNSTHPIKFAENADGGGDSEYTTGVTVTGTAGSSGAQTELVVDENTPSPLYYYCANHSGMGSSITITIA